MEKCSPDPKTKKTGEQIPPLGTVLCIQMAVMRASDFEGASRRECGARKRIGGAIWQIAGR
ncbi:hypothetical protein HBH92_153020 [Parastagonospora nodorum]|nr:hypothetical protein HBH92_153020 [Parastagonospora nodorum]KAH4442337.1 hypothetical protein HBH93_077030 [Parastagonospora nodorum]KAH4454207.1 hypothetical protein HBH91_105260 [Parastagonospora nodorum]KAH4510364.1 hypothetical protein HBH89_055570 [Parastagonospora nodorum]KAH4546509.1 hypothetical protein HBH86_138960 [Parastagonospora nodorum]